MVSDGNGFWRLLASFLLWNGAGAIGSSLVYLYFKNFGLGLEELALSFIFMTVAPLLIISAFNKNKSMDMKTLIISGVSLLAAGYALLAIFNPSRELLFLISFLIGAGFFFFFIPFNIMYFRFGKGREAVVGSLYFSVYPLLSLFLPLIAGLMAQFYGYGIVFSLAALMYTILVLFVLYSLSKRSLSYDLTPCLTGLEGFKTLIFLDGIYNGGIIAAVSVISLLYFKQPAELGVFLSITMLFSVLASYVVSRLSDRSRKRRKYIRIIGSGLGMVTAAAAFVTNAFGWTIAIVAGNFFLRLFYPFTTAILLDRKADVESVMVGREWLLNCGKLTGAAIVLFFAVFSEIRFSLLILGLVILAYPIVL